ncbi:MAG: hypothetical protein HYT03_00595 [Candidatus Harrisonbacteria bacterium]|nr:hypothetical protein [Candidatus Harrisonbacteria bacterium]
MSGKRTQVLVAVGLAVVLGGLFLLPRINNPNAPYLASLKDTGIACLNGHANLSQHFHPHITVLVDGIEETIHSNVGVVTGCMAEIHTHDTTGTIHVESTESGKIFRLKDFFTAWNNPIEKEGYNLILTVNDIPYSEIGELILSDGQQIVLTYTSK